MKPRDAFSVDCDNGFLDSGSSPPSVGPNPSGLRQCGCKQPAPITDQASKQAAFAESGTSPTDFSSAQGSFNLPQAAAYCGVKVSAIEDVVRSGRLPGRRLGRNVVIRKVDLDEFLTGLDVIPAHVPLSIQKRREARLQSEVA